MSFENKLLSSLEICGQHHRDKEYLKRYFIQTRLNDSLNSYYKELKSTTEYLCERNPESVIKKL